jgi:hypothetical protein
MVLERIKKTRQSTLDEFEAFKEIVRIELSNQEKIRKLYEG